MSRRIRSEPSIQFHLSSPATARLPESGIPTTQLTPGQERILHRAFCQTYSARQLSRDLEHVESTWNQLKAQIGDIWMTQIFHRYTGSTTMPPTWATLCLETNIEQIVATYFHSQDQAAALSELVLNVFEKAWDFVRQQYPHPSPVIGRTPLQERLMTRCFEVFRDQLRSLGWYPWDTFTAWALMEGPIESIWGERVFSTAATLPADWEGLCQATSMGRLIHNNFSTHDDEYGTLARFVRGLLQEAWETRPTHNINNRPRPLIELLEATRRHLHNANTYGILQQQEGLTAAMIHNTFSGNDPAPVFGFHLPMVGFANNNVLEQVLNASLAQMQPSSARPLQPSIYASFPRLPFAAAVESDASRRGSLCAICQTAFEDEETLVELPQCHHIFHEICGTEAFNRASACPLCRHDYSTPPRTGPSNLSEPSAESAMSFEYGELN
jgi:hypothetical protein